LNADCCTSNGSTDICGMSFLANDTTGALTAQVTRLLRDETTDNIPLLLEMVEGGGVNRRILGYLFGISVFHHDKVVADRARALLRLHAGTETVKQAEKLKEGAAYHYNEAEYLGKYRNQEFDIFDFILANKMCLWHRTLGNRSPYFEVAHRTLNLSNYPEQIVTDALATLDFVRYITLPAHRHFDLAAAMPILLQMPLEQVYLENLKLHTFPSQLFALPKLKVLSIRKGSYRPRDPVIVLPEKGQGSASLEKLIVEGYPIEEAQHLGPFPALLEVDMTRCNLRSIDFLVGSTRLSKLNLKFNHLGTLPEFLGTLTQLTWIDLSHNPFQQINLDLSNLYLLEHLEIKWGKA
jgi:hypothetical protein